VEATRQFKPQLGQRDYTQHCNRKSGEARNGTVIDARECNERSAVRAVVALAKLLSDAYVESPEPVKSLLSAFSLPIPAIHTPHH
jgi:hypothetical protein